MYGSLTLTAPTGEAYNRGTMYIRKKSQQRTYKDKDDIANVNLFTMTSPTFT